ncbi:MAG TPA: FHA domain-containing protein [Pyrinomonadaceae bacterium]|nr:FHA domain-containing protein [Pyrinomonadaceae bacterium]
MTTENSTPTKKTFSFDWLVRGTLTKLGVMFDELTGRNWKPASNLATSEIIERLKALLDAEAQDLGVKGKFVPHNVKLLMQWDKFSTDAEDALKKLESELLTAAIDHINDRRYHTHAPLDIEIKTDYFTEGVKLRANFGKFADDADEPESSFDVAAADLKNVVLVAPEEIEPEREVFVANFAVKNNIRTTKLTLIENRRLSVGRTKENALWIDDESVSKLHASLVLNREKQLLLADTGSTNGTFVNGERIAYGKAFAINKGDKIKFGAVDVAFERLSNEVEESTVDDDFPTRKSVSGFDDIKRENVSGHPIDSEQNEEVTVANTGGNKKE